MLQFFSSFFLGPDLRPSYLIVALVDKWLFLMSFKANALDRHPGIPDIYCAMLDAMPAQTENSRILWDLTQRVTSPF